MKLVAVVIVGVVQVSEPCRDCASARLGSNKRANKIRFMFKILIKCALNFSARLLIQRLNTDLYNLMTQTDPSEREPDR